MEIQGGMVAMEIYGTSTIGKSSTETLGKMVFSG
jgi:hypothetical protein